jgi:hypothetical protein
LLQLELKISYKQEDIAMNFAKIAPWTGVTAFHDKVNRFFDDSYFCFGGLNEGKGLNDLLQIRR